MTDSSLPLVSVVVPCKNRAHYLRPTLDSILNQDYPHIECVVVDGVSTDGTIELLQSYGERIRWVSERDRSAPDAINKGFRMSSGDIVAWLNADDTWAPGAVAKAVTSFQERPEADVIYGECGVIDADGEITGMCGVRHWDLAYALEAGDFCLSQSAVFIRRPIMERIGWLDSDGLEQKHDHDLWLRLSLAGAQFHYLPEMLAFQRNHPGNMGWQSDVISRMFVVMTKRILDRADLPPQLQHLRRRAMSNAYLRGAGTAVAHSSGWGIIVPHMVKAVLEDPTNWRAALNQVRYPLSLSLKETLAPARPLVQAVGQRMAWLASEPTGAGRDELIASWIAAHLATTPPRVLDFGCGATFAAPAAARQGAAVTAIDLRPSGWLHPRPQAHLPGLRYLDGDIRRLFRYLLPPESFDLIITCATLEHLGAAPTPYNYPADTDIDAARYLFGVLRPGGTLLLAAPVGRALTDPKRGRVYDAQRLAQVLTGYVVQQREFWVQSAAGVWDTVDEATACATPDRPALGLFVLQRPAASGSATENGAHQP